jgi:hypothetical protein
LFIVAARSKVPEIEHPLSRLQLIGSTFEIELENKSVESLLTESPAAPPSEPVAEPNVAAPSEPTLSESVLRAAEPSIPEPNVDEQKDTEASRKESSDRAATPSQASPTRPVSLVEKPSVVEKPVSPAITSAPRLSPSQQQAGTGRAFGGVYGAEGESGAPSQLRRAFLKTLPLAAKLDPAWLSLTAGELGSLVILLTLDEGGRLIKIEQRSGQAHPSLLRAAQKNQVFLKTGHFMVAESNGKRQLLIRLRARVEQHVASEGRSKDPEAEVKVVALGVRIDPSDRSSEPTGAYFTFGNGQHVEFELDSVP